MNVFTNWKIRKKNWVKNPIIVNNNFWLAFFEERGVVMGVYHFLSYLSLQPWDESRCCYSKDAFVHYKISMYGVCLDKDVHTIMWILWNSEAALFYKSYDWSNAIRFLCSLIFTTHSIQHQCMYLTLSQYRNIVCTFIQFIFLHLFTIYIHK